MTTPTVTVRYYVASDREIYWTVELPDSDPVPYCANRYATFLGHDIGQHQVHGWHSTPLPLSGHDLRNYFLREVNPMIDREYYPNTRISVRTAGSMAELSLATSSREEEARRP